MSLHELSVTTGTIRLRGRVVKVTDTATVAWSGIATGVPNTSDTLTANVIAGSVAPVDATFLTLSLHASLTNERVFTPAARLAATDGGANGAYTLDLATTAVTPGSYTYASLMVDAYGRLTAAASGATPTTSGGGGVSPRVAIFSGADSLVGYSTFVYDGSVCTVGPQLLVGPPSYTPSEEFEIYGTGNQYAQMTTTTTTASSGFNVYAGSASMSFYTYGNTAVGTTYGIARASTTFFGASADFVIDAGDDIYLATGGALQAVLLDTGYFGVGTATPVSKVHAEDNTDSDADVEVVTIGRSRSSATTPGLGFGGHLSWRLEGFTNNSSVDAVQVGGAWRGAQSNDTTARDSYWYVSTMLDATLGERLRVDSSGGVTITQAAMGSSAQRALLITPGAHTGNPASNELIDIYFNLQRTETWNAGTVAAQRAFFIDRPTYGSASGSAVFTYATTVAIAGPPAATTGGEITAGYALMIGNPSASTAMGAAVAGSLWASLRLSTQVVAYTGTTTITSDGPSQASIGQLTVAGDGSAIIVDNAQAILLSPPHGSSGAVLKKLTGIRVSGSSTAGTAQAASIYRVYYQEALTVTYTGTTGITSDQGLGNIAVEQITFTNGSACTISYLSGIAVNIPTTASLMAATEISGIRIANNTRQGAASAGMTYRGLNVVANTVTYTGTTGITSTVGAAGVYIGQITVADSSAMTMTAAAGLYVADAPTVSGSAVITNKYAIWVDAGLVRFDDALEFKSSSAAVSAAGDVRYRDNSGYAQVSWNGHPYQDIANNHLGFGGTVTTHPTTPLWLLAWGRTDAVVPDSGGSPSVPAASRVKCTIPITRAGVLRNMYVRVSSASGASQSYTVTIRINDTTSGPSVTLSNSLTGTDASTFTEVVAGDEITVKIVATSGAANAGDVYVEFQY